MTRRALVLLVAVLALVSSGLARPAAAQVAFGLSAVEYNPESTLVSGYSLTLLDFTACLYYDAYVEGYLFEDVTNVDADGERGVCVAEAFTEDFGTGGHFYTQLSDHYIVAFVFVPGFGYYDPYGYGLFGGEYGDRHDFVGCICPSYYFEDFIYLGSTAATIFLEPPCNKTPTLKATPSTVERGGKVTFTIENLCPQRTIKDWMFVDNGTVTVTRATNTGSTTWEGKIVKTGLVAVTVTQGGITLTPFASVTVTDRTSGFSFPKVASREDTSYPTGCTAPSFPSPPEPNKELGEYCLLEQWSFTPGVVGNGDNDNGPNKGYHYIVSARHTSTSGAPTEFVYIIHPELKSTSTEFYKAQCGDYDAATDTGHIGGDQLLANARNHEGGEKNSHYQHYVDALKDKTKNIGDGLEQVVGPPGESDVDFKNRANTVASDRNKLMQDATKVEPCGTGFIRGPNCEKQGAVNFTKDKDGKPKPYTPCRPSGLMTTEVTASQVDLKWTDNSANEEEFQIARKLANETTFFLIGKAGKDATTFADKTVAASTKYSYVVQARVEETFSFDSNVFEVKVPPIAPSNLTATALSTSEIRLDWDYGPTYEQGFKIERRTETGSFSEIFSGPRPTRAHTDSGRAAGTTYFYQIRAFNENGISAYSDPASAKTQGTSGTGPQGPTGLGSGTVSASQVTINWTDNSSNETGFKIERKTGTAAFAQIATVAANVTTYNDAAVVPSTTYTYRVAAFNAGGDSPYSNEINATTPAGAPPNAPSGLTAAASSATRIDLGWSDNSSNETGFKIERRTGAGTYSQLATVGANVTTFADTTVSASTTYTYRVTATGSSASSAPSNEATATTPAPPSGLAAPANFTAAALSSVQVQLAWTDTSSGEDGFKIERKDGGFFEQIGLVGPNVTGYVDVTVTPNTAYTYRVRAYKGAAHSPYSNEAATTTQGIPLPAPAGNLTATLGGPARVDLAWSDQSWNELGFRIERKTDNGAFAQIATVPANVTVYADSSVAAFTTYTYRVVSFGEGGSSLSSNWATVTTPSAQGAGPAAPCCLQAWTGTTNSGGAFVSLTWADLSSDETGFRVERRDAGAATWSLLATLPAGSTSFGDNIVSLGWTYQYRVGAVNLLGISYSGEVEVTAGQ